MDGIEHRTAPYVDSRLGAEAEPTLVLIGSYAQREQQALTGGRQVDAADSRGKRAALVVGKTLSLELRLEQPIDVGKRNVDGHCDIDAALLDLRHELQLSGERAVRLGLAGH